MTHFQRIFTRTDRCFVPKTWETAYDTISKAVCNVISSVIDQQHVRRLQKKNQTKLFTKRQVLIVYLLRVFKSYISWGKTTFYIYIYNGMLKQRTRKMTKRRTSTTKSV